LTAHASSSNPSPSFSLNPVSRLGGAFKGRTPIFSLSGLSSFSPSAVAPTGDKIDPSTSPTCLPPAAGRPLREVLFRSAPPGPLENKLSFLSPGAVTRSTSDKSAFSSSSSTISSPPNRTLFFRPAVLRPNFSSNRFITRRISPSRTPNVRSVCAFISGRIDSSI
jgi:hypothetical protein